MHTVSAGSEAHASEKQEESAKLPLIGFKATSAWRMGEEGKIAAGTLVVGEQGVINLTVLVLNSISF